MIHLTSLQSVALKVISLAQDSAFTLLGQQVTGSNPGWGTWNFSIFKYLCIMLASFTTEGVCLFPKLGAFWRFVTRVKEELGMWKALSLEDFHHEMGWIIEWIIHWSVVSFYLVYTPLVFEDLDVALRKKEIQPYHCKWYICKSLPKQIHALIKITSNFCVPACLESTSIFHNKI